MYGLEQKIHQAAGFRLLNIAERFFKPAWPVEAEVDEVLIHLKFVVEEGDL